MMTNLAMAFFFGWLVALSFVVYKMKSHYIQLTSRTRRRGIDDILDEVLQQTKEVESRQHGLKKQLDEVQSHLKGSYQKIGLVRFDAFGKSEGEQSFVLALLNKLGSGVVINFFYTTVSGYMQNQ